MITDRDGSPISRGDLVEFWFSADNGYSLEAKPNPKQFTLMRDIVVELNGELFFWNLDLSQGAYAWRHASYCRIVGRDEKAAAGIEKIMNADTRALAACPRSPR